MFPSHILLFTCILSLVMCHLLVKRHIDFRERFLERKRERQIKAQRILVLDKYVLRNSETLDDITHYRMTKSSSTKWKKIKAIESDFRRLLAMDGMKYNYKRDLYWRTWRSLLSESGVDEFVCYKCNNPIEVNATGCQNCGMWTIEERPPPCPYEFFSLINDEKLCGVNYTQYKDVNSTCPSVIKFSDMTASCDNPIETMWRFSKLYGVEDTGNIICDGKDFCEIFTSYEITPAHVIFRIINSTNDVMYSRIMKPNNTNYICIDDCGRFNPNSRKVRKSDKPLKLDLLSPSKTKREDNIMLNEIIEGVHMPTQATKLWNVLKKTTLSMSKVGGKYVFEQKSKLNKMKGQHKTLDFHKGLFEEFILGFASPTSPQPSEPTEPTFFSLSKTTEGSRPHNTIVA